MSKEIEKLNNQMLELVNAAAQEWQTPSEKARLLNEANRLTQLRNKLMASSLSEE